MSVLNDLMEKAPDNILREFARKCALRHVEKIKPYCSDEDYQVIVTWLETGDESIREAALWAAKLPAELDACSAAYSAYWAAYWAACSARSAAKSDADSNAESAREAETQWQEQTLIKMMDSDDE